MSDHPAISPSFASEAARQLQDGNVQQAIDLCTAGISAFPKYAAGHLVLGKCYEAFGRPREAFLQFREALNILPDNPTLQELVKKMDDRHREEFRKYLEEQEKRYGAETQVPKATNDSENQETTVDYLSKRLQNVKRIQPNPSASSDPAPLENTESVSFVTPTMAEILVEQEKYAEAINAYREWMSRNNDERYTQRVAELEKLHTLKQPDGSQDKPQNTKAS